MARNAFAISPKGTDANLVGVFINSGSEPIDVELQYTAHVDGESHVRTTHFEIDPGKPVSYGFGWFLYPYWGHPRMWHTGSTMGFRTIIERLTADNLTIIILSNRTDLNPETLAVETADLYLNLKPKE